MPIISYMGEDFDSPNIQVQDNGSATDLDDTKVPTGRTVESYANSKIQNDGSATDLDNTKVPTGQTIESYINKNLRNNEIGSWVNIAGYTSSMYTCQSDGYVMFNGSNVLIEFHSATNDNYVYAQATTTTVTQLVYVRKGMRIKVVGTVSLCRFIPF